MVYWQKTNKYKNKTYTFSGKTFDSKKEYKRYTELLLMEQGGMIHNLKTQVKFELIPAQYEPDSVGKRGGKIKGKLIERAVSYIADFVYTDKEGKTIVEDVKGYKVGGAYAVFTIKRKLMLYMHGIKIKEI